MKLGAQLYSVRNTTQTPEGIRETFRRIHEIGYENVQLSGAGAIDAAELAGISNEFSLPIVCTHSPIARILHDTDKLIEEHKIFGCDTIGLGIMDQSVRTDRQALESYLAEVDAAAARIRKSGLRFAYHNHAFEFSVIPGCDRILMDMLIDEHPDWDFILDTYWVEYAGRSAKEYIERIGSARLKNVHFKDMAKDDSREICHCGGGRMDFSALYEVCSRVGVQNALVEQDNAPDLDAFAEMEASFKHLRPIVH